MKYAAAATILSLAALANASPIKRDDPAAIVCQALDGLPTFSLKDSNANVHQQALAAKNPNVHTNIIASEGLIGTDDSTVFYELYNDPADRAAHFIVQQCNSTAVNAYSGQFSTGDVPVKLVSAQDTTLCASASDRNAGVTGSTSLKLLPCNAPDTTDDQLPQFWTRRGGGNTVSFVGNVQIGSEPRYWSAETGGGDSYRTPSVMANPCTDDACQAGAVDFQIVQD